MSLTCLLASGEIPRSSRVDNVNVEFMKQLTMSVVLITGGKGQYTQWVHCELIVGPETIRPAHTQRINGGHFQKVPTHLPSPNPGGK